MKRAALLVGLCLWAGALAAADLVVGSKNFTESVILGEIAAQAGREQGLEVRHWRALGGTRIVWEALRGGDIQVYPEYTGTLTHELLSGDDLPADTDLDHLRRHLADHYSIGITGALGFNNTYALGMREKEAGRLGIETISDLRGHPGLKLAFSNEFMDRADGWPKLRRRYSLPQSEFQGMDHDLAYRGLADGAIDVTDLYATDAEIRYYKLRVLEDDRNVFPAYNAVFLYRLDLARTHPGYVDALGDLAGRIPAERMIGMNAAVKLDGRPESEVAAEFLGVDAASGGGFWERLLRHTLAHLRLVAISLSAAVLVAVPLGVAAARFRVLGQVVLAVTGILQTVPSLALFVFMIPLLGIGGAPAMAALFLYSLLPIVRNTHAGLTGIPLELRESAAALGLPAGFRLWRIELPLALRSILAGVKIAAVINVGTATLGALIGAGGYGQPILTGIRLDDMGLILEGAVPAALLALAVQGLFELVERLLTPRGLRLPAGE